LELSKIFDEYFKTIQEKHVEVKFENTVIANDNVTFEDVSDLNGIAIPFLFEYESKKNLGMMECSVMKEIIFNKDTYHEYHIEKYERKKRTISGSGSGFISVSDFFFYGNVYRSIRNKFRYYLEQLDNYSYLEKDYHKLLNNMRRYIKPSLSLQFEKSILIDNEMLDTFASKYFSGIRFQVNGAVMDIYDPENNCVYEIKCVETLQFEHKLQLAIYAWLFRKEGCKYYLLNARNGHLIEFNASFEQIENIMYLLLKSKYIDKDEKLNDESFVYQVLMKKNYS